MITISKTPLRVSLFGGGTDYPEYFQYYPGAVLGMAVSLYVYTAALPMVGFADQRYRITYRDVESVTSLDDIKHPVVREVLRRENYDVPLNISIISDVPGGTGLGSSSAFTVGFLSLIKSLKGDYVGRFALASAAIDLERNVLSENVGIQDQLHAAFGGFSKYDFFKDDISVRRVCMSPDNYRAINDSLFLIYTGLQRSATSVAKEQIKNTNSNKIVKELNHLKLLVEQATSVLEQKSTQNMLSEIGQMLNDAWKTKRSLSPYISNPKIDLIHERSIALGAYGAKLCGAGGGGFLMALAPNHLKKKLAEEFGEGNIVQVSIDEQGTRTQRGI